jgi:hypothetical protein
MAGSDRKEGLCTAEDRLDLLDLLDLLDRLDRHRNQGKGADSIRCRKRRVRILVRRMNHFGRRKLLHRHNNRLCSKRLHSKVRPHI